MNELQQLGNGFIIFMAILIIWTIPWKGVALWKSARNNHKWWFIAMLLVNSLAILEIIYIFGFSKNKEVAKK
ncbi:MAG TPA: DUF5652 family protein [bacterium]|nr:DUF5652 family protein [bacterium]HPV65184.1 DUF5652 family protein [bacterium]